MENVGIEGIGFDTDILHFAMMGSLKQEYQKAYSLFPFHYKKDQRSLFL